MNLSLKRLIKKSLGKFDIDISRQGAVQRLISQNTDLQQLVIKSSRAADDLELLFELRDHHASQLLKALSKSKSQLRQDLFVLSELDFKLKGFFVEFGATNGFDLSNTHLLEKEFNWTGILAEPAKSWRLDLRANRNCHIDTDCVWRDSNSILNFNEVDSAEFSTISSFSSADHHQESRREGKTYDVKTISLVDLLRKYNAPRLIDYLSIDTEGSEFEILNSFNFDHYQFKIITCEHNFTSKRKDIFMLLTSKGYVRKFEKLSKFDDWYVKTDWS